MGETVGPFKLIRTVGEGATGKVKEAVHKDTGERVAIKIIDKNLLFEKESLKKKVEREIAIMKLIQHKNLVKLYEVLQTRQYLFIIQEFIPNGELYEYIVKGGSLSPLKGFQLFKQIIAGVAYLHEHKLCHRDLKPENILMRDENNIVIADFGMANIMNEEMQVITACGSPHYAAPEVMTGKGYDGTKADIWSCGVILYVLMAGYLPFEGNGVSVVLARVKLGSFTMPDKFDDDLKDLISKMLHMNPKNRLSINQIRSHPYYKKMVSQESSSGSTDEASYDYSSTIENPNDELVQQIVDMGWTDKQAVVDDLKSKEKTMLTIIYQMLEARRQNPELHKDKFEIADSIKVNKDNPLTMAPPPAERLRQEIKESMEDANSPDDKSDAPKKKRGILGIFNRSKKNKGSTSNQTVSVLDHAKYVKEQGTGKPKNEYYNDIGLMQITTNKTQEEMFHELIRVCRLFKIMMKRSDATTITATLPEPADLKFEISVSQNSKGETESQTYTLNFKPIWGNANSVDVIFNVLRNELNL